MALKMQEIYSVANTMVFPYNNFFLNIIKIQNVDKGRRGGGGQPMRIIIKFSNNIIKSANLDKGAGGKTLIHKMWIKRHLIFLLLPNTTFGHFLC